MVEGVKDLIIFNRWGAEVFHGIEWDGRVDDRNASPGVYVYLINVVMDDGLERQFSGSVTLVR